MYVNNFDLSSSGVNMELSIYLDGGLARIYFEDFTRGYVK